MKFKQMFIGGSRHRSIASGEYDGKPILYIPVAPKFMVGSSLETQYDIPKPEQYRRMSVDILGVELAFWVSNQITSNEALARIREAVLFPFER